MKPLTNAKQLGDTIRKVRTRTEKLTQKQLAQFGMALGYVLFVS